MREREREREGERGRERERERGWRLERGGEEKVYYTSTQSKDGRTDRLTEGEMGRWTFE